MPRRPARACSRPATPNAHRVGAVQPLHSARTCPPSRKAPDARCPTTWSAALCTCIAASPVASPLLKRGGGYADLGARTRAYLPPHTRGVYTPRQCTLSSCQTRVRTRHERRNAMRCAQELRFGYRSRKCSPRRSYSRVPAAAHARRVHTTSVYTFQLPDAHENAPRAAQRHAVRSRASVRPPLAKRVTQAARTHASKSMLYRIAQCTWGAGGRRTACKLTSDPLAHTRSLPCSVRSRPTTTARLWGGPLCAFLCMESASVPYRPPPWTTSSRPHPSPTPLVAPYKGASIRAMMAPGPQQHDGKDELAGANRRNQRR